MIVEKHAMTPETRVVEGLVRDSGSGGLIILMDEVQGTGWGADELFDGRVGMRVRVTVEVLETGGGWFTEAPWDLIKGGHKTFLIRGHGDDESAAIPVKIVSAEKKTGEAMAMESVMIGLKWSRMFDVVGDGNAFQQRPLYEVENAMWKKR